MPETALKKVDFEPYFLRWNSAMFYPDPANPQSKDLIKNYAGDGGVIPVHQHKACNMLVNATGKYPPRVCPHCHVDTSTELTEEERRFDPSVVGSVAIHSS